MIKHYIAWLLLFAISVVTSRSITTFAATLVGIVGPRFGRDVERDVWELRRYAYIAYPAIREREQYYHLHDAYPVWPYDGNKEVWNRHPGYMHIIGYMFPYYRAYTYIPETDLMEPVDYGMDTRIGPGSLLYDSSKRAWWLYGFDYMKDYLDNFPELITPP